jgi:hypothetical protein
MKSNEAEKRRELAEETGIVMSENDPENDLREFLKRKKSSAGKNASANAVVSPSPKKARRSERQKLIQNDEHPHVPANGKLLLPVELHNMLLPLDAAERSPLVSCFVEKDWLPYKGQDPARCVRRFMQKALKNPDNIQPHWNNRGGGSLHATRNDLKKSTKNTFSRTWA